MDSVNYYFDNTGKANLGKTLNKIRNEIFTEEEEEEEEEEEKEEEKEKKKEEKNGNFPKDLLILFLSGKSQNVSETLYEAMLSRSDINSLETIIITTNQYTSDLETRSLTSGYEGLRYEIKNIFDMRKMEEKNFISSVTDAVCNYNNDCIPDPCKSSLPSTPSLPSSLALSFSSSSSSSSSSFSSSSSRCLDKTNSYVCECGYKKTGINCQFESEEKIDMIFALDEKIINNKKIEIFVSFLINKMAVGLSKTRIGALTWGEVAKDMFHLDTYFVKQDVILALEMAGKYFGGKNNYKSNLTDAFRMIEEIHLKEENGKRNNSKKIIIIIIKDHVMPEKAGKLLNIAKKIKLNNNNLKIFAIITGEYVNKQFLRLFLLFPVLENSTFFHFPLFSPFYNSFYSSFSQNLSFYEVEKISHNILNESTSCDDINCHVIGHQGNCTSLGYNYQICNCHKNYSGNKCQYYCIKNIIDIIIILDISGSGDFEIVINQNLKLFYYLLLLRNDNIQISIITFGNGGKIEKKFNENIKDVEKYLNKFTFNLEEGKQSLDKALNFLVDKNISKNLFSRQNGYRNGAKKVSIIITSSSSPSYGDDIMRISDEIKENNIEIFSVLIGKWPSDDLFVKIVKNKNNIFYLNGEKLARNSSEEVTEREIEKVVDWFVDRIC